MGGSGKWMKSLMGLKKSETDHNHQEKLTDSNKGKKWKLWRNSSGSRSRQSEATSETSSVTATGDPMSATLAALARAPPKDFLTIRQEWAAVQIQSAFRSFLARRALKALKGIVKIQALVRGRKERKKVAVTYQCMQAIFRVQEKVRAQRLEASSDLSPLESDNSSPNPVKLAEDGWCDKAGSVDEIRSKIQMRQDAAIKRERALSYALSSQQQWKAVTPNRKSSCSKSQETNFSNPNSVQVKRNNISTRVVLKPVLRTQSGSFSDFDSSSPSSSSPAGLSYMGLTESTKAKMSQRRKALSNVSNLENVRNVSGVRVRKCGENKENRRFEGRMSPFA
ncbi:hypothetical protein LUZ60_000357 [Juncus effusus]|nr:hypothetical protein LUZ60_000357 [Juncus effusus]